MKKPKILLYCQHLLGVGHLTRSIAIAEGLKDDFSVTFIQGGPSIHRNLSNKIQLVEIPPLLMREDTNALYDPEEKVSVEEIFLRRRDLLKQQIENPYDAIIVELFPFGRKKFKDEILWIISEAKKKNKNCKIYCSLRDILVEKPDFPTRDKKIAALVNEYFDAVFVHSDPTLISLDATFSQSHTIEKKIFYSGFVREKMGWEENSTRRENRIIVSQGGGIVGVELLENIILVAEDFPDYKFILVTGPNIPLADKQRLENWVENNSSKNIILENFLLNFEEELSKSKLSISLAGYNTIMNILNTKTPSLVYPYDANREQRMRAERLEAKGFLHILNRNDFTRGLLIEKINRALSITWPSTPINLSGVFNTKEFLRMTLV